MYDLTRKDLVWTPDVRFVDSSVVGKFFVFSSHSCVERGESFESVLIS